mmetsp:Transcript_8384/g.14012  ORF Transcript_8384/g.14012 Transcript_8384/m.14012 type:complete len:203 (-) Transcript_8384:2845-3453(-)
MDSVDVAPLGEGLDALLSKRRLPYHLFALEGEREHDADVVALHHIVLGLVVVVHDVVLPVLQVRSEVLELLGVRRVPEDVVGVDALEVHLGVLELAVLDARQLALDLGPHPVLLAVLLLGHGPLVVLLVEAVGVGVDVLVYLLILEQQALEAAVGEDLEGASEDDVEEVGEEAGEEDAAGATPQHASDREGLVPVVLRHEGA